MIIINTIRGSWGIQAHLTIDNIVVAIISIMRGSRASTHKYFVVIIIFPSITIIGDFI